MKRRRNSRGQYISKWEANLRPLLWLMAGVAILGLIWTYFKKSEVIGPCEGGCSFFMVRAAEPEVIEEPVFEDDRPYAELVYSEFGEEHFEDAMKIMFCESRYNAGTKGDTHIMTYDPRYDEMIGDSIGLFQVRTGGLEKNGTLWNRARANNMTAEEFRVWLEVPENNIKYAKTIFDRRGWSAWWNCMNKELNAKN